MAPAYERSHRSSSRCKYSSTTTNVPFDINSSTSVSGLPLEDPTVSNASEVPRFLPPIDLRALDRPTTVSEWLLPTTIDGSDHYKTGDSGQSDVYYDPEALARLQQKKNRRRALKLAQALRANPRPTSSTSPTPALRACSPVAGSSIFHSRARAPSPEAIPSTTRGADDRDNLGTTVHRFIQKIGEKRRRDAVELEVNLNQEITTSAIPGKSLERPVKRSRTERWEAPPPLDTRSGLRSGGSAPTDLTRTPVPTVPSRTTLHAKRTRDDVQQEESDGDVAAMALLDEPASKKLRDDGYNPDVTLHNSLDSASLDGEGPEENLPRPMLVSELPKGHPLHIEYADPQFKPTPSASRTAPTRSSLKRSRPDDDDEADARPAKTFRFAVPNSYSPDPNEHNSATWRNREYAGRQAREQRRIAEGKPRRAPRAHRQPRPPRRIEDVIGSGQELLEEKYQRYEKEVREKCGLDLAAVRRNYLVQPLDPHKKRSEYEALCHTKMMHSIYPPYYDPVWRDSECKPEAMLAWEKSPLYYRTREGPDGAWAFEHERDSALLAAVQGRLRATVTQPVTAVEARQGDGEDGDPRADDLGTNSDRQ